jgi:hypothetical protein
MSPLLYIIFFQNFKTLKFLYDLVFHQVHSMNMHFHRRGHVFFVKKILINCMTLCIPFDYFFFKCTLDT